MKKIINRSKGVIFLAILLLVSHSNIKLGMSNYYPGISNYYERFFGNLSNLFLLIDFIINIAGVVIAIGLLFLKDYIRKAVIILHFMLIPYSVIQSVISYPNIAKNFSEFEIGRHHMGAILIPAFTILLCLVYISFFMQPEVKEQFK